MVGLFERKPREWRDDDYVLLEDLKGDKTPKMEEPKHEPVKKEPVNLFGKTGTVKERLERLHQMENHAIEKRKGLHQEPLAPKPLNDNFVNENIVPEEKRVERPDSKVVKKVENAVKKLETVKHKMEKTNSFLSLFYDLKKAEKELIEALDEAQNNMVDLPDYLEVKIKALKSKMRAIK